LALNKIWKNERMKQKLLDWSSLSKDSEIPSNPPFYLFVLLILLSTDSMLGTVPGIDNTVENKWEDKFSGTFLSGEGVRQRGWVKPANKYYILILMM
jgi:hypothetical protein